MLQGMDLLPKDTEMIMKRLDELTSKVDSILEMSKEILRFLENRRSVHVHQDLPPDVMSLLSLPGSLRRTVLAIYKLGEATAEELSEETGRKRAMECSYANQLVRMGYLKKKRKGRKVVFYIGNNSSRGS